VRRSSVGFSRLSACIVVTADVHCDPCQVVPELVSAMAESTSYCLGDLCCVKREVSERDDFVIAAMVKEYSRNCRKLPGNVARQLEVIEVPLIVIPYRGGKHKQPTDGIPNLLF
jgi:hypothetical protein